VSHDSKRPYIILAYDLFWTGTGWSDEALDAYSYDDEIQACRTADQLKDRFPDKNIAVWKDYGFAYENEIYQARGVLPGLRYHDGEHEPDLGDTVEVSSEYFENEKGIVTRIGREKLRVRWVSEYIKPRSEWVTSSSCELISRAG